MIFRLRSGEGSSQRCTQSKADTRQDKRLFSELRDQSPCIIAYVSKLFTNAFG